MGNGVADHWNILVWPGVCSAGEQYGSCREQEMTGDVANFLQYGAFGLLALVLIAVGIWFKGYSEKQQQIASEQQAFVRRLAERALTSQDEHMEQWREMTRAMLKSHADFTRSLQEINKALGQLSQEHTQITTRLS